MASDSPQDEDFGTFTSFAWSKFWVRVHSQLDTENDGHCNVREFTVVITEALRKSHVATIEARRDAGIRRGRVVYVENVNDSIHEEPEDKSHLYRQVRKSKSAASTDAAAASRASIAAYDQPIELDGEEGLHHYDQPVSDEDAAAAAASVPKSTPRNGDDGGYEEGGVRVRNVYDEPADALPPVDPQKTPLRVNAPYDNVVEVPNAYDKLTGDELPPTPLQNSVPYDNVVVQVPHSYDNPLEDSLPPETAPKNPPARYDEVIADGPHLYDNPENDDLPPIPQSPQQDKPSDADKVLYADPAVLSLVRRPSQEQPEAEPEEEVTYTTLDTLSMGASDTKTGSIPWEAPAEDETGNAELIM